MVTNTKVEFGVGEYWTAEGQRALVDKVLDTGELLGRVNISMAGEPLWVPYIWAKDGGVSWYGSERRNLVASAPPKKVERSYWLNVYTDGPGLLRNTWEEALVEASREEKQPLCRVEVKVDSYVGEGLK